MLRTADRLARQRDDGRFGAIRASISPSPPGTGARTSARTRGSRVRMRTSPGGSRRRSARRCMPRRPALHDLHAVEAPCGKRRFPRRADTRLARPAVEATGANIFLAMPDGRLHTPTPDCFLDGITRRTVIGLARARGIEVVERAILPDGVGRGREIFGTAAEVTPVGQIDERRYAGRDHPDADGRLQAGDGSTAEQAATAAGATAGAESLAFPRRCRDMVSTWRGRCAEPRAVPDHSRTGPDQHRQDASGDGAHAGSRVRRSDFRCACSPAKTRSGGQDQGREAGGVDHRRREDRSARCLVVPLHRRVDAGEPTRRLPRCR